MSPRPKVGLEINEILEAAGEIADVHGMREVTLANLAKRLNIRPPSLYNHFEGLGGLRKKMAIYGIDLLYKEMAYEAVGVSGEAAVLAISKAYVEFARKHPGLYEATLLAPDMEDEDVQQAGAKIVELSVRVLQAFDLQGERALHAVRGFRSILHGFSSLEQSGGFKMALDLDESLEIIIKAFIKGMRDG
ncbi:WHG domain-containing protein [Neobacillus niacini]|uniref:TetR/AcrR family transcriptional regulator n=1 Tax=Neobacillus niacini TaxID=86668 RepID=UPI002FFF13A1